MRANKIKNNSTLGELKALVAALEKMAMRKVLRAAGGDLFPDGTFVVPLNDETTLPVLNAMLMSGMKKQ